LTDLLDELAKLKWTRRYTTVSCMSHVKWGAEDLKPYII
jgi:hypothetical protein